MGPRLGFLRIYLFSVLFIGLIGLADAGLTFFRISSPLYVRIVTFLLFLFFFFNIFSIAIFRKYPLPRIVFVLPIYHISSYILFLSLGLFLTIKNVIPPCLSYALIGMQVVSALFEMSFSIYLLTKFDSQASQNL